MRVVENIPEIKIISPYIQDIQLSYNMVDKYLNICTLTNKRTFNLKWKLYI